MSFSAYYLDDAGSVRTGLTVEEAVAAFRSNRGLLWVDITETTKEDCTLLADVFGFHRLAVEDCLEPGIHSPKIDNYGDYLFCIFHGVNYFSESAEVETAELELFLGSSYVVSNHNFSLYSVEEVRRQVEATGYPMKRGADFLAYSLIDTLVDNVLPAIDRMSELTQGVEEEALGKPRPSITEAILRLKRSARSIHRTMVPQRELVNRISRGEYALIKPDSYVYFRDIYDHLVRIEDLNTSVHEGADNALSIYLTVVANRQNETMRVLAIAGAIFLPLTLLAGVYGMNFDNMPELHWRYGYYGVLTFMAAVIVTALAIFWKRQWFSLRRTHRKIVRLFTAEPHRLRGRPLHAPRSPASRTRSSTDP